MKYKLYTTSQKAWDGMFEAMKLAKKSIYIEMFIFLADTEDTHNFLGLLKEKAKAGLEIIIIADAYGSFFLENKRVKELREVGVEFIFFNYWLRRTHRKIVIIDEKVAFLGGVNIKNAIRNWYDLQIKLEGRIVKPIIKSFAKAYRRGGGKKQSVLDIAVLPLSKKIKSWITDNWHSTRKIYYLNNYYKEKINGAQKSIQIVTPYLLPPRWLIAGLSDASQRGVVVEIIIPGDTDIKILNRINYLNSCRLSALGVKIYLTPLMNHAKLMLIDENEGVLGSQNMDVFSFGMNKEVGVFFSQKNLVADLKKIVERWKNEAVYFKTKYKEVRWYNRILIAIIKLFYPIF